MPGDGRLASIQDVHDIMESENRRGDGEPDKIEQLEEKVRRLEGALAALISIMPNSINEEELRRFEWRIAEERQDKERKPKVVA